MAKIVVVEDEDAIRRLIVEELEDDGHDVIQARNGVEGLEVIVREKPDLVLSDITMPRMNGHELLLKLQESYPQRIHTPFIFLTALADRHDVVKGMQIGADDYVTKPIDFELLLTRVRTRLRQNALLREQHEQALAKLYKHLSQKAAASEPAEPLTASAEIPPGAATGAPPLQNRAGWMAKIVDGEVVAGHVETMSLQKIRTRLGADWQRLADRVLRISSEIVHKHLGDGDLVHATALQDFVIAFADPDEAVAKNKVQKIAAEIWTVLFGEFSDNDLAEVRAGAHKIVLRPDEVDSTDSIAEVIQRKVRQKSSAAVEDAQRNLLRLHQYEDIYFSTLHTAQGRTTRMKSAHFTRLIGQKIQEWTRPGAVSRELKATLDVMFLQRVISMMTSFAAGSSPVVIVPIRYGTAANQDWRAAFLAEFEKAGAALQQNLVLKVVGLPDLLPPMSQVVPTLPGIGRARILEVGHPRQIHDVDLRELKVGLVAMSYHDAVACRSQGLASLHDRIRAAGAKFIIEHLPEDHAIDVRALGADLFVL